MSYLFIFDNQTPIHFETGFEAIQYAKKYIYIPPNKENEFLNKMNEFDFDMLNYCYGFSCFSITLITNCYNYL